jgi:hypothetical protein
MNEWESDPDAWKKGFDVENEAEERPQIKTEISGYAFGVRPLVEIVLTENTSLLQVKDRDALKKISSVGDGQKAKTEEGETYLYKYKDNMWYAIPEE